MQSFLPLPQSAIGVFQKWIFRKNDSGASAWYLAHEPLEILSISLHASLFTGVSPKYTACWACTFGVEIHASHLYAQSRFFVLAETIQVSSQPVAPSRGIMSFTGAFASWSVFVWYGHEA